MVWKRKTVFLVLPVQKQIDSFGTGNTKNTIIGGREDILLNHRWLSEERRQQMPYPSLEFIPS